MTSQADGDWQRWCANAVEDLRVAVAAAPDATVAAYPRWTVRDLAVHVIDIYTIATAALHDGGTVRPTVTPPVTRQAPPERLGVALRQALDAAEHALTTCQHDTLWGPGQTVSPSFWRRRLCREAALHRWDAQEAAGAAAIPESALSLALIDEFLDTSVADAVGAQPHPRDATVLIQAGTRRWIVDLAGGTVRVGPHDLHDWTGASVTGDPASVWLWLARRDPLPGPVQIDDVGGAVTNLAELLDGLGRPA